MQEILVATAIIYSASGVGSEGLTANDCPFLVPPHFHRSCIVLSEQAQCAGGFRETYVGIGSDPVDGCGENEEPDDGNHGRPRGELEMFVYILSLQCHLLSAEIKGLERRMR